MPRFSPLLASSVAVSGASALIYELLWIRALGLHFGTTTPAITTVIATFMAGLGLGNLWFGARADRSPRPFRLCQHLEIGIALSALCTSLVLLHAGPWLDALAKLCAAAGSWAAFARAGVLASLMLVPATAMGGTLPALTRALSAGGPSGRALGLVYGCNTLGAVAGALAPDFVFIPRYGLSWTACIAACGNLLVALILQRYARLEVEPAPRPRARTRTWPTRPRLAALALSACSGFCALGLEVLWSRTLQHWAAALITSFAVLLAVYLMALSCGTLLAERFADRCRAPLAAAAILLGLGALGILVPIASAPAWRELERAWWPRPAELRRLGLLREAVDALLHASFLEVAVCLLLGAAFPFLARAWLSDGQPGVRTGQLLLVNTFAGVLGALTVGFAWLPGWGEQASYCVLALLLAGVSALCAMLSPHRAARVASAASVAALLCLVSWLPERQLFRAHFRSGGEVIAVQEGATTTGVAVRRYVYGEPYYAELLTPGISMSHTRIDARRYMALMAHAAALATPRAERALLICYGVGNTASALLAHPSLKRLDVVDISPEVLALAPHFAAARGDDPLADARTHVFVDDGRHHLITFDARYDVITMEPPPPNYAGVVNLYSREFYRLAKRRLSAGGVATQWLPVFQLADGDVRAMIAAFVAELPHAALLYGHEQQWILIGALQPFSIAADRAHAIADNLRANGIGTIEDLLGSMMLADAELRREAAGSEPLSDERPTIQYPFEALGASTRFTLRSAPARARGATQAALSALPVIDREPSESRELELGRLLQPALDRRPQNEGLWNLLGVDADRVQLAERALQRPGASELLAPVTGAVSRAAGRRLAARAPRLLRARLCARAGAARPVRPRVAPSRDLRAVQGRCAARAEPA